MRMRNTHPALCAIYSYLTPHSQYSTLLIMPDARPLAAERRLIRTSIDRDDAADARVAVALLRPELEIEVLEDVPRLVAQHGVDVRALLFEVWGGWSPAVMDLWWQTVAERGDKLRRAEYDDTTWAARTWLSFVFQRLSVAVHKAVAREVSDALGLSAAVDPRGAPRE